MSNLDNNFIEGLSNDLKPGRHMRPSVRALFWGLTYTAVNVIGIMLVSPFRPTAFTQLAEFPRFAIEMGAAVIFTCLLIYVAFNTMVPGKKIKNTLIALGSFSFIVLVYTIVESFSHASPPASPVGARLCVEETLGYAIVGMGVFSFFARKSFIGFSRLQYFVMGAASGLVPGVIMQMACLYSPKHSLLFHYGPALVTGAIACLVLPFFKRR